MSTPTYRFSFTAFSRYAFHIGSALRAWPDAIGVVVTNGKVDSYVQPLRDAITAKTRHGYKSEFIDEALFKSHGEQLVVSAAEDGIWIGSADACRARRGKKMTASFSDAQRPMEYVVKNHGRALEYACLLVQSRCVEPLPTLVVKGLSPERLKELENQYPDVILAPCEDDEGKLQII